VPHGTSGRTSRLARNPRPATVPQAQQPLHARVTRHAQAVTSASPCLSVPPGTCWAWLSDGREGQRARPTAAPGLPLKMMSSGGPQRASGERSSAYLAVAGRISPGMARAGLSVAHDYSTMGYTHHPPSHFSLSPRRMNVRLRSIPSRC
jgi:hypothetical protein